MRVTIVTMSSALVALLIGGGVAKYVTLTCNRVAPVMICDPRISRSEVGYNVNDHLDYDAGRLDALSIAFVMWVILLGLTLGVSLGARGLQMNVWRRWLPRAAAASLVVTLVNSVHWNPGALTLAEVALGLGTLVVALVRWVMSWTSWRLALIVSSLSAGLVGLTVYMYPFSLLMVASCAGLGAAALGLGLGGRRSIKDMSKSDSMTHSATHILSRGK